MKKMMLIVNPRSGKGQGRAAVGEIAYVFRQYGYAPTVYITSRPGEASEFAAEFGADYPLVSCVGGDGTLSEVLDGLMRIPEERRPVIGYMPMGTANDIAASLRLSKKPGEAAEIIMTGQEMELDVGMMNGKAFAYVVAFGAFSDVPYTTPQSTKNAIGHLAYMLEGAAKIPTIRPYHTRVSCDQGDFEDDYLFGCIMNTLSVGGVVKFDPEKVGLSDGYFEIVLVKKPKNVLGYNGIISSVLNGKFDDKNITFLHTKRASFEFDEPVAWTRDGEDGGRHLKNEMENLYRAARIIVPKGE